MRRDLASLQATTFDVIVIGGGISGACIAYDASLRGLSVALIERGDFGAETSAASSKLLHGGIRYLQQARIDKVRESASERAHLQRLAPHLTHWVPFLIPTHPGLRRGRPLLQAGMAAYELLTKTANRRITDPAKRVPAGQYLDRAALAKRAPALAERPDVTGAQVLYESHLHSSERMTLAFIKSAVRHGAAVANYAPATRLLQSGGRLEGVTATDALTGASLDVRGRVLVNAAGPWLADLNDQLTLGALSRPVTGFSRGAHIITRPLLDQFAVALPTARKASTLVDRGGRHIFIIPWRGLSLIGTSDRPHTGGLERIVPDEKDVAGLLADVAAALPSVALTRRDVRHAFAGLYPLTAGDLSPDVYQGSGDFQIIDHGRAGGVEGAVSALGAKYTTARRLGERATDLACAKLGRTGVVSRTTTTPLVGGDIDDLGSFTAEAVARHAPRLDPPAVRHLIRHYGTEADAVVDAATGSPTGLAPLATTRPSLEAEVTFAVDREMAVTLDDVVFRRTGLGTIGHPGDACLRRCATLMADRLGWSADETDRQLRTTAGRFLGGPA